MSLGILKACAVIFYRLVPRKILRSTYLLAEIKFLNKEMLGVHKLYPFWSGVQLTTLAKLLWNFCAKADKLCVRWVRTYFINSKVIQYQPMSSCSCILKAILQEGCDVDWYMGNLHFLVKFPTGMIYKELKGDETSVKEVVSSNVASPQAHFIFW